MPASIKTLFGEAAGVAGDSGERVVTWHGAEGNAHRFVVPLSPDSPRQLVADSPSAPPPDDFSAVLDASATVRVPVTNGAPDRLRQGYGGPPDLYAEAEGGHYVGRSSDAIVGTIAHRLFGLLGTVAPEVVRQRARMWLTASLPVVDDATIDRALACATSLQRHPALAALLASGRPLYEVPFSLRVDPTTIVRGSIDCLIRLDDGRVVVVELKTGARRPEHEAQLAIYVDAARAIFPGRVVEGLLVYGGDA